MPLAALTAGEREAALAAAQSDVKWLLADAGVGDDLQAVLYHNGFTSTRLFVGLAETRAELRDVLRTEFGLDAQAGLAERQQVAVALAAWDAAKEFVTKDNEARAEARSAHAHRPASNVEHTAMRAAYEAKHGRLHNSEVPGKYYLGKKAEDIEDNEPRAESLKEVHSKEDGEDDYLQADLDASGALKIRKGAKETKLPQNSEELRAKIKLLGNCWLFLKTKHTNRHWLADIEPATFQRYADYLVGKHVMGLRGAHGGPLWSMILTYEYELRKQAYEWVLQDGIPIGQALSKAVKDMEIKNSYLIIPMTLQGTRETGRQEDTSGNSSPKRKRSGKGGSERLGSGQQRLRYRTPDGRLICFKFNNRDEQCDGSCGMVHVCQFCAMAHPKYECPTKGGGRKGKGKKGGGKRAAATTATN